MKNEPNFIFKNRNPIAPLKIIAMENCRLTSTQDTLFCGRDRSFRTDPRL